MTCEEEWQKNLLFEALLWRLISDVDDSKTQSSVVVLSSSCRACRWSMSTIQRAASSKEMDLEIARADRPYLALLFGMELQAKLLCARENGWRWRRLLLFPSWCVMCRDRDDDDVIDFWIFGSRCDFHAMRRVVKKFGELPLFLWGPFERQKHGVLRDKFRNREEGEGNNAPALPTFLNFFSKVSVPHEVSFVHKT